MQGMIAQHQHACVRAFGADRAGLQRPEDIEGGGGGR